MVKARRLLMLLFVLIASFCAIFVVTNVGTNNTKADSLEMVELGSVSLQSGTSSYEDYTGTTSSFDYNLGKAYKSNENSWWDYAAYSFSFDKFKAQTLGINDYSNASEVSAAIGTYQNPGTAVPFEVFYAGHMSLGNNNITYSIGNGSSWVFSATINTWDCVWTLTGAEISNSAGPVIGAGVDYNTTPYGGNERHVVRVFVDYAANKIIVANGSSTVYSIVDCNFGAYAEDICYVRFNSQASNGDFVACVWVESIMGDKNLKPSITVGEITGAKGGDYSVPATINYLGEDFDADITLYKNQIELPDLYIDSIGAYTVRYSIDKDGKRYYKDYDFTSTLPTMEEEIGGVSLQSGTHSYEDYTGTTSSFDYNLRKAYKSNENGWYDYAAYGFSFDDFKAQTLGINDYSNASEVSAAIGTYQNPGTAVPFEVFYTGHMSLGQNTIVYSIGSGSSWVFSANIDTYYGSWTLSGAGISNSAGPAIGQDYNTTSYGGNARHVIRVFVDYSANKIIVANGNSTGYSIVDCNFGAYAEDICYVRFNSQASNGGFVACVWVESIMGETALDDSISLSSSLENTLINDTLNIPSATIHCFGEDHAAHFEVIDPDEEIITSNSFTVSKMGAYTVKYFYIYGTTMYYKSYQIQGLGRRNAAIDNGVSIQSGNCSYETYIGVAQSSDFTLGKAYKSSENGWNDFAAYNFDDAKFKAQTLGVSNWSNTSEISAKIGTYLNPGTAVPFAVYFTGGFSDGALTYSIGNNAEWAINIAFTTATGDYTLSGDCVSGSGAIGQDYIAISYGGNARHVLRIFIDYSAGKLIIANANNSGFAVYDCNFASYTGSEFNYVRFNANGRASGWVYTESIMGEKNLNVKLNFDDALNSIAYNSDGIDVPDAYFEVGDKYYYANKSVIAPDSSVKAVNATIDQLGTYIVRYSYTLSGVTYIKDYNYNVLLGSLIQGAAMRTEGKPGIRFGIQILESDLLDAIDVYGNNLKIGMRITSPNKTGYVEKFADIESFVSRGDYRVYYFVLTGFSNTYNYYNYDFTANGFMELDSVRYYYDNPIERSVSGIAILARSETSTEAFTKAYTDSSSKTFYYDADLSDDACQVIADFADRFEYYAVLNNTSGLKIVLATDADDYEILAANELKNFFNLAAGVSLDIIRDYGDLDFNINSKYLSIGNTYLAATAGIDASLSDLNSQGYIVKTVNGSVFMQGVTSLGSLYAVYGYLAEQFDFAVYSNDEIYIETVSGDDVLVKLNISEEPDFEYRQTGYWNLCYDSGSMDNYAKRSKISTYGDTEISFMTVEGAQYHNTFGFLPYETYGSEHSGWYYKKSGTPKQLCFTAHGDSEELALMKQTVVDKMIATIQANPNLNRISFTYEDNTLWCTCSYCGDLKEAHGNFDGVEYLLFANDVAKAVKTWCDANSRTVDIVVWSYYSNEDAPVKLSGGKYVAYDSDLELSDNLYIFWAPISAIYSVSFESAGNEKYLLQLRQWSEYSDGRIYAWLYNCSFGDYMCYFDSFTSMQANYQLLESYGCKYIFDQGCYDLSCGTGFANLKVYLQAQLQWNVDANFADLLNDYFNNYFKDAAVPMRTLFNSLSATFFDLFSKGSIDGKLNNQFASHLQTSYFTDSGWFDLLDAAFDAIEKYKNTDSELYDKLYNRILAESISIRYMYQANYYDATYSGMTKKAYRQQLKADMLALNFDRYMEGTPSSELFDDWGV